MSKITKSLKCCNYKVLIRRLEEYIKKINLNFSLHLQNNPPFVSIELMKLSVSVLRRLSNVKLGLQYKNGSVVARPADGKTVFGTFSHRTVVGTYILGKTRCELYFGILIAGPSKPGTLGRRAGRHTERASCISFDDVFSALRQPRVPEDEACPYLNVHVPSTETTNKAVFVFIYGGGYVSGSGNMDLQGPEYIVSRDVILVTFNYRLGLFGFICLDIPEAPGNLAGRDMAAALRWVRRDIAAFGGDPDNVTVGAHSAGAASAQFVALSPLCEGLFKRVIIMGGGAFNDWAIGKQKTSAPTIDFAKQMNISETNPTEMFNKLKSFGAQEITKAGREMSIGKEIFSFKFVVEKTFDGVEPFLSVDPEYT